MDYYEGTSFDRLSARSPARTSAQAKKQTANQQLITPKTANQKEPVSNVVVWGKKLKKIKKPIKKGTTLNTKLLKNIFLVFEYLLIVTINDAITNI